MRASFPSADVALIAAHIEISAEIARVRSIRPSFAEATPETLSAILREASKFASDYLSPLNDCMDSEGCMIKSGRLRTAPGHKEAWRSYVDAGWPTLDQPAEYSGQHLPLIAALAVQETFDRACPAFGMLPVPQRAAARLIAAYGDGASKATWLPLLAAGKAGATICISEAGAGSDVGLMRTRAVRQSDDAWSITGEKCWISFGDHDLTERIVHCVIARTDPAASGVSGLSLFLVPGGGEQGAAVSVRRIEKKMGLHGSPTCALGFDGAAGVLLGEEGRGLAQMFVMITQMRLAVGVMGLGIASACADAAMHYAAGRLQGGPPNAPVPIARHPDVQRQLFELTARVETLRGLLFAASNFAELAAHETDEAAKAEAEALTQWLLPIVKTAGADAAFDVASGALQVLGGAGYTREWPVEQAMRDARVLAVFEGTTGIQALDLVHRRLLRGDAGLRAFMARARAADTDGRLGKCLDLLDDAAKTLKARPKESGDVEAGATAFLQLAILAATGWISANFIRQSGDDPETERIVAAGNYWLDHIGARAALLHAESIMGKDRLARFAALQRR